MIPLVVIPLMALEEEETMLEITSNRILICSLFPRFFLMKRKNSCNLMGEPMASTQDWSVVACKKILKTNRNNWLWLEERMRKNKSNASCVTTILSFP